MGESNVLNKRIHPEILEYWSSKIGIMLVTEACMERSNLDKNSRSKVI